MSVFNEFEHKLLEILVAPHIDAAHLDSIISESKFVSFDHTKVGYYLTASHPALPTERVVCDKPVVTGVIDNGTECGFIVFLQNGELTIECYTFGEDTVPRDIRERNVEIDIAT